MSTMLSDKVEQVGGAVGAAGGLAGTETSAGARPLGGDIRDDLRRWKDEVLSAIDERLAGAGGSDGPSRAWQGAGGLQTREAIADVGQAARSDAREFARRVEDYVREHPLKALGIAGGTGFLLGVLWSS
jgi:ElaB/YqjD/DUF883 family membrane-anchored ribosome-binding protein